MLEVDAVCKTYPGGTTLSLHPTSLSLAAGATSVLIGPSGCGKSTLLRIIMGVLTPDSGTVRLQGETLTPTNAQRLRQQMGCVTQDGGLFPHLTARDNVLLLARHLGQEATASTYLGELLDLVQLGDDLLNRYPSQLSGGQRQRVSLLRALVLKPKLVILDEPMGALDPMIRSDLQSDLKRILAALRQTMLLVTHDLAEAAYFADEILLLRAGQVLQRGGFRDFVERPADPFVTRFVHAQRGLALGMSATEQEAP
jgi:osmoprotectant transport system ATP-binding protein